MPARGPVDWPALFKDNPINSALCHRPRISLYLVVSRRTATAPETELVLCMRAQTRHTDAALQSIGAEARPLPGQNQTQMMSSQSNSHNIVSDVPLGSGLQTQ